jgi:hypothetical protein
MTDILDIVIFSQNSQNGLISLHVREEEGRGELTPVAMAEIATLNLLHKHELYPMTKQSNI